MIFEGHQVTLVVIDILHGAFAELTEKIHTADGAGIVPCLIQSRKQNRCQDRDDRNHYQELYERKAPLSLQ